MKRLFTVIAASAALVILLAACGDGATATPRVEQVVVTATPGPTATPTVIERIVEVTPILGPTATPTIIERIVEVTPTPTVLTTQQVVDSYVRALNSGDVPALANLWAKDGTFTFGPLPDGSSETENGLVSDIQDLEGNPQFDMTEVTIVGETAKGLFSFTDDESTEFGGPLTGSFELTLQQGKIQSIKATPDEATQARLTEVFGEFGFSTEDIESIEVDPAELERYLTAIAPVFETAFEETLNEEFGPIGPTSDIVDVLAFFRARTDIRRQLIDSLAAVEPPAGAEPIHEGLIEAASDWVTLIGDPIVDLLENAGPDFSIADDLATHTELGIEPENRLSRRAAVACQAIEFLAEVNGVEGLELCRFHGGE